MIYLRDALTGECVKLSLLALRSKAYWDYNENFLEACREDLTLTEDYIETNHVYIFEKDEEIIGFFSFVKAKTNRLDFLYLAPRLCGDRLWQGDMGPHCSTSPEVGNHTLYN